MADFHGAWTRELIFGNKVYWKRNINNLCKLFKTECKLKSDSSLRDDLRLYNENKIKEAENMLNELDKQQNNDMKLRNKNKNNLK